MLLVVLASVVGGVGACDGGLPDLTQSAHVVMRVGGWIALLAAFSMRVMSSVMDDLAR